jgi:hypothetical protein
MYLIKEISNLHGSLSRQSDSRYAVSVWYIPGGCDYANAYTVVGFWPEDLKSEAETFQKKYEDSCEMAVLVDLQRSKASKLFQPQQCKNCQEMVNFNFAFRRWESDKSFPLHQYCWVDPMKGSQRHVVSS